MPFPPSRHLLMLLLLASMPTLAASHSMTVTASAFTTAADETQPNNPGLTAWGDHLKPGMKAIAVSRDLIKQGLTHGTAVTIKGLAGTYIVRDKMNRRWRRKIDIYMTTKRQALAWGVRRVTIIFNDSQPPPKSQYHHDGGNNHD